MARTIPIQQLISAIEHTDDDNLIIDLYHRMGIQIDKNVVYQLNDEELKGVNEGLSQLKKGESSSHEELMKKAKKWLA
jgi:hypothetical protein